MASKAKQIFARFFFRYFICLSLINTLFVVPANGQSAVQIFDDRVIINLMDTRTPEKNKFFVFMSNSNTYGDVGVPAGLLIGGWLGRDQQMRQNALFVASSTAVSFVLTTITKIIVKRRRPFIQNLKIVPVYRASGYSFPSGHSSSSFSTATALSIAYPKWYVIAPAYLWSGGVAYSRMYFGVHYPTDVATGAALGAASAVSMSFLKK